LRLDKWLWQARFCKTRTIAADLVSEGHVRLNGTPMAKPGHGVAVNDVLTLPHGKIIRVVRIVALGVRRGPSSEAQSLYIDLEQCRDPPSPLE
jgi:ribosome-associated heat shock protein Hsp15